MGSPTRPPEFVACDMPEADRTFLQMVCVFAEHEARMISVRTKAALQRTSAVPMYMRNGPVSARYRLPSLSKASAFCGHEGDEAGATFSTLSPPPPLEPLAGGGRV